MPGSQISNPKPPGWLKPMNKVLIAVQRTGLKLGGLHVLTVVGRRSGKPRATPLSVLTMDGQRYILGGFPGADWVRNARAAGQGVLARGKHREDVRLVELPAEEARPVLRVWPVEVPTSIDMMINAKLVTEGSPEQFERLAGRCPVFRLDPID